MANPKLKQVSSGRYHVDERGRVGSGPGWEPAEYGRPAPSINVRTAVGAVDDPWSPGRKIKAVVNRRVDVLEHERSAGLISEAAYQVGRELQKIYEIEGRVGSGSQWSDGDRVDAASRHEDVIAHTVMEDIPRLRAAEAKVQAAIGRHGAAFVRAILTGRSFASFVATSGPITGAPPVAPGVAMSASRAAKRRVAAVASHWRALMEALAEELAAVGPERSRRRAWRSP